MTGKPEPPILSAEEMAQRMLEILAELNLNPPGPSDPGLTAGELQRLWGKNRAWTKARIQKLKRAGRLIEGKRWVRDKKNNWHRIPVYRPKEDE